ncbi:MAG: hypothetical protein J6A63_04480 [Clostridia bacterium]|nr:hypothetical protein [Clostridia bacterium]
MRSKKFTAVMLAALCSLSFVGCGDPSTDSSDGDVPKNNVPGADKTTIKVVNFNGGIGTEWLDEAAERFATARLTKNYATGKTGVYVDVEPGSGITLDSIGGDTTNLYFTERKWDIDTIAQNGELLDITDVIKDETREGGSLETVIKQNKLGSITGNDGKYYGLPHYEFFGGLTYDVDVFTETKAYLAAETATDKIPYGSKYGTVNLVASASTVKSNGPDGTPNTLDDGLPATMQELIILMDYFKNRTEYKPVALSGLYNNYSNYFLSGLWAALAGYEQMTNYYNCEGQIDVVTGYTTENIFPGIDYIKKPKVEKVTLNGDNGYLGNNMAAKYYAIAMLEIMQKEGFFTNGASSSGIDHYGAQKSIIYNPISSKFEKCAMLMEASYWYNEATLAGSFDSYKLLAGNDDYRNISFMPLPSAWDSSDAQAAGKNTIMDIGIGVMVANGNIKNNPEVLSAVKDFISFLYSNDELVNFTKKTGMTRPFNYTLNESDVNALPLFSQSVYKLTETSNVVYYSGTTSAYKQAKGYLKICLELPKALVLDTQYNNYLTAVKAGSSTETLFAKTQYSQAEWANIYKK